MQQRNQTTSEFDEMELLRLFSKHEASSGVHIAVLDLEIPSAVPGEQAVSVKKENFFGEFPKPAVRISIFALLNSSGENP